MPTDRDRDLGKLAVQQRLLDPDLLAIDSARFDEERPPVTFGQYLVRTGRISTAQLADLEHVLTARAATVAPPADTATLSPSRGAAAGRGALFPGGERYELRETLGEGGMGRVIRAYDRFLQRTVAMKLLRREDFDEAALLKFLEEAQATAQLQHPNIVPIHDVGLDSHGRLFFTMREVEGSSLRDILIRLGEGHEETTRKFPLTRRLQIFEQICYAVGFGHSRGVVHRDLKPDNIMVGPFGEVFVMDWGLAKIVGGPSGTSGDTTVRTARSTGDSERTMDGALAGTPHYMSPEQARGATSEVDGRSDVFALGAILFELVTLRHAFDGRSLETLLDSVKEARVAPWGDGVPRELSSIGAKAMSKRPGDRYAGAAEVVEDLQSFAEGRRGQAWRDTAWSLMGKWLARHRTEVVAASGALLVVAGIAVWLAVRPGTLSIATNPNGAEVVIDGRVAGITPMSALAVSSGGHSVELRLAGHRPERHEVRVPAGSEAKHTFNMFSLSGTLSVATEPPGAEVWIDGEAAGKATVVREVAMGRRRVRVLMEGYVETEMEIPVPGGHELVAFTIALRKNVGVLAVETGLEGITVRLLHPGGRAQAAQFPSGSAAEAPAGRWIARFEKDGWFPVEREVEVRFGESTPVAAHLVPRELWRSEPRMSPVVPPIVADFDGDGIIDAAFASGNGRIEVREGPTGRLIWARDGVVSPRAWAAIPATGSVDLIVGKDKLARLDGRTGKTMWEAGIGDLGRPEIWSTMLEGGPLLVREMRTGDRDISAPRYRLSLRSAEDGHRLAAADFLVDIAGCVPVKGSSGPAFAIALIDGEVLLAEPSSLEVRVKLGKQCGAREARPLAAGDFDGDGQDDLLCTAGTQTVRALRLDGKEIWTHKRNSRLAFRPAVADLDGDGAPEAILATSAGEVVVLEGKTGQERWRAMTAEGLIAGVSIADLDGDHRPEILACGGDGRLRALDARGAERWSQPVGGALGVSVSLADVTGDGFPDVVLILPDGSPAALDGGSPRTRWTTHSAALTLPAAIEAGSGTGGDVAVVEGHRSLVVRSGRDGSLVTRFASEGAILGLAVDHGDRRRFAAERIGATVFVGRVGGAAGTQEGCPELREVRFLGDVDGDGITDFAGVDVAGKRVLAWFTRSASVGWEAPCPGAMVLCGLMRNDLLLQVDQFGASALDRRNAERAWSVEGAFRPSSIPVLEGVHPVLVSRNEIVWFLDHGNVARVALPRNALAAAEFQDGVVAVGMEGGEISAWAPGGSEALWTLAQPENASSMRCLKMDGAEGEGIIVGSSNGTVDGISGKGRRLWVLRSGRGALSVANLGDSHLVAAGSDGILTVLSADLKSCEELWQGGNGPSFDGRHNRSH